MTQAGPGVRFSAVITFSISPLVSASLQCHPSPLPAMHTLYASEKEVILALFSQVNPVPCCLLLSCSEGCRRTAESRFSSWLSHSVSRMAFCGFSFYDWGHLTCFCEYLLVLTFSVLSLQAASSALSSLGHVYTAIGDYPNALASHKQCVLLAKQSKDELSEARELGNMGAVYIAMGDFENAVQCHEQHLKIAKELGNKREEARAYSNLGSAYHYRRNFDKAMSYHNYVLELAQELAEKAIEMRAYAGLGHAARCMQDLERAKQYHEEQLHIAESLQDRAAEGRASSNLGKDMEP